MLVDDSIDVTGLATSAGSIALQDAKPAADAALVAKLKAAGAVILGDTNVTELGGVVDTNMPQGYSSLGGQVLLPADTNKNVGGSSGVSQTMTRNVFEGLTSVDVDGEVVPTLAKSWDVAEDGLTVTFHLQDGVVFHDGTPLTSADVVWSITQAIAPESKSARKSDLLVISEVTAPDDATVELHLSRPSQGLTFYLASVTIVKDGDTELTRDNGTGPYRFVEWKQGDQMEVVEDVDVEAFRSKADSYLRENFDEEQLKVYEGIRETAE